MIDLKIEIPLPLADAARLIPPARTGKKTHISTLVRWIQDGLRNHAGQTVKLEALRLGNRWMTSREALQRFAERLTPPTGGEPMSPPRTPTARRKASEQAVRELDRIGI